MGNKVRNAHGLDGANDWATTTAAAITVDELEAGAPGRAVVTAAKAGLAIGGVVDLATYWLDAPVIVGQVVEVFASYAGENGAAVLVAEVVNAGGAVLQTVPIAAERTGRGEPRRGLAAAYSHGYARFGATSAGFVRLRVQTTAAAAGEARALMFRPWVDTAPGAKRSRWSPGPSTNPDLNPPAWPTELPVPADFAAKRVPNREGFAGDSGVPHYRRKSQAVRFMAEGSVGLDQEQRDRLERFLKEVDDSTEGRFWFVRPDTLELCRATVTDEGPDDSGTLPGARRTSLRLLLEVA